MSMKLKYSYVKYLAILIPVMAAWFVLIILPNLQIFVLAFQKWNGFSKVRKPIGWQNFQVVLGDPNFTSDLVNTILYVLFLFAVQTVLSLCLALVLRRNTAQNHFFRTFFFLPLVFSSVMVGLTWSYMYDANLGIINQLLCAAGLTGFKNFNWMGDPTRGVFAVVMVHIWANVGYPLTILTAGLSTIPETLYEAAEVEGAKPRQSLRHITLPLLMPTILRLTLLTFSTGAMAFDYVLLLGAPGMRAPFDTLSVGIYKGLTSTNLGLPAVKGVVLGIILMVVFLIQFVITRRVEDSIN